MRFVIITGMSGAGKSQVLHCLEDLGYFCMDNLPPQLMGVFLELLRSAQQQKQRVAVSMDCRSGEFFTAVDDALESVRKAGFPCETLFLDAKDDVLIARYKENRRTHPLSNEQGVAGGIAAERAMLAPLREGANLYIDTTQLHTRELHEILLQHFTQDDPESDIQLVVKSFGFKNGVPPDADMVFDVRFLPNPFYIESMRPHTGLDEDVRDYVFSFEAAHAFLGRVVDMLASLLPLFQREGRRQLIVAVGCTGGRHRSVALSERIAAMLGGQGFRASVRHRDIAIG